MQTSVTDLAPSRVLVLDDEHLIADTLSTILSLGGFEVMTAYSGERAVEAARDWPPDIFLGDVVMPGVNGIEAAIRIRTMHPGCRVVLFSGQAATTDLLFDARRDGHQFEIILKPVHPARLMEILRKAQPR